MDDEACLSGGLMDTTASMLQPTLTQRLFPLGVDVADAGARQGLLTSCEFPLLLEASQASSTGPGLALEPWSLPLASRLPCSAAHHPRPLRQRQPLAQPRLRGLQNSLCQMQPSAPPAALPTAGYCPLLFGQTGSASTRILPDLAST